MVWEETIHQTFASVGCDAYMHVPDNERKKKLNPKSKCCIFLGYSKQQQGYILFDINENKFHVTRDVTFDENKFQQSKQLKEKKAAGIDAQHEFSLYNYEQFEQIVHDDKLNTKQQRNSPDSMSI